MSSNDQADGFWESPWFCGKCGPVGCVCVLSPTEDSGKGRKQMPEKDVYQLITDNVHFRLVKGFNLLRRAER